MSAIQLHTCGAGCPPDCQAAKQAGQFVADRNSHDKTIDFHCHALIPKVEGMVADLPEKKAEMELMQVTMGAASVQHNNTHMLPNAGPRLMDLNMRLQDMDAMGVDIQVLSPAPSQYYYWAKPDLAQQIVLTQNEAIAELCAQQPERLAGLGTVALQHPGLAIEQVEYAVRKLGLKGVEISTSIDGRELNDPEFEPFWAKVEQLNCVTFIHPFSANFGSRLEAHYLSNIIGQPLETTIALSQLIFGGVLDRYPELKLLAAHGGGYLPSYMGRSDHGYRVRPEAASSKHKPSHYLKQIWFDSLIYSPTSLRYLIDQVGISQIVIGTDYPFDMGSYNIHELLASVANLSEQERRQILFDNAAQLLNLQDIQPQSKYSY